MRRTEEEEEFSTPHIEPLNLDAKYALATQLEEHGHLLDTTEVVSSFENEPDVEAECERVHQWRNWRLHLEEIRDRLSPMSEEEKIALQWL